MIGTRVAHYEILEQLGQGGMGIVYKARDTRLDRFVALKFLPPHLSADPTANARFIQEAKAASALDHANICTVYEIGQTDDGRLFISMPFYSGETLKYRLQQGPLSTDQAVRIAVQVAQGLGRAHEAGIVHRDVKPANIMVTDRDEVKILDFGIAKLGAGAGMTTTGSTIGTVAYMSPEQAQGRETDARSDLWAVGVLMYEMLTGSRPFKGDYDQAVIYGLLNEEPAPLARQVQGIPSTISDIVVRLLSKDPADRFQSAGELVAAFSLQAPGRGPAPPERPSFLLGKSAWVGVAILLIAVVAYLIVGRSTPRYDAGIALAPQAPANHRSTLAVLPFSNLRSDPETDFLGYALADQVIGSLTYVENLTVRPASSVRQYQDGDYDVQQAGTLLGVDYVMAGNYLHQGDQMRLTVELVDVDSREMIWREPIELEYRDVFSMQDMVAERLLRRLEVQFSEAERSRMRADVPSDPVAYEYFLRALSYPEDKEGNRLAIDLLEQTVALDSTFAPAWNELGARLRLQGYWDLGGQAVSTRAMASFGKALELNPDMLSALSTTALLYTDAGELDLAYEAVQRMLEIKPNHAEGHFARGYVLRYAGVIDESVREMRYALAADSTNPKFRSAAWTFITIQDYAAMEDAFRLSRLPGLAEAWGGEILRRQGRLEEARSLLKRAVELDPSGIMGLWAQGVLSGVNGDFEQGRAAARKWEQANLVDAEGWYFVGALFCFNRAPAKCMELLKKSVEIGYYNYTMYENDPFLDGIRDTPEFQELLARVRAESEAFRERHGLSSGNNPSSRR